jgi:membrane peptidoglycan carboxypeptidase
LTWLDQGMGLNAGFEAGITSLNQSRFKDSCNGPYAGTYKFRNDARESGGYNITRATGASVNSVFLQMAMKLDQCDIREMAQSIGVHTATGERDGSDMETRPSCVIGGCQTNLAPMTLAAAYAAIAGQGVFCNPKAIDTIIGPDGTTLPTQDAGCAQKVRPEVANAAAQAMASVLKVTASRSNPNDGTPYIGKTGTTNDAVHTWMVGSSTRVATAVWVGNVEGFANLRKITVNRTQAAILRHLMFRPIAQAIDKIYPGAAFAKPDASMLAGKPTFVPDVTGATLANAQATIENADLAFADGGQVDSDKPVGTVVSTDPAAGSSVSSGATVTVYTSNGQGAAVPDVSSGKNQDLNAAKATLQSAGFTDVAEGQCSSGAFPTDADLNKVVAQDPAAGTIVNKGAKITLSVRKVSC